MSILYDKSELWSTSEVKYDSRKFAMSLVLMMSGTRGKTLQAIRKFIITQTSRPKLGDDIFSADIHVHLRLWLVNVRAEGLQLFALVAP